ncbi:hypothetical protein L7F22_058555 [Adiantum nelumboides]|nr:hypothetical protein [Adiantum nelumboides]
MAGGGDSSALLSIPTWAIAVTCAIFILVSLAIERAIHFIGHCAGRYNHAAFLHAFDKMKDELLMVGILSLALAMGQDAFAKACVPASWYKHARLCDDYAKDATKTVKVSIHSQQRRHLAPAADATSTCKADHVEFMPAAGIHDLHIFVFALAAVHIAYTVIIIAIGMWIVGRWKVWEARVADKEKLITEGGARITVQTTFVRRHAASKWSKNPLVSGVVAFFKQFFRTVTESDYVTLRGGFIKNHFADNPGFNFYNYIERSFQDDFKHVVGISPALWVYAIVWLLLNVNGWETNLLVSFVPLLLVLVIGTKMQLILTQMANEIQEQNAVILGMPIVKPNDMHFWFGRPRFVLKCFHFIVFQNALGTAYAVWAAVTFPTHTCINGSKTSFIKRIVVGVVVQVVCAVVALPVYALVSQMGSKLKKSIFNEDVNSAVSRWKVRAKKNPGKGSSHGKQAFAESEAGEGHSVHVHQVEMAAGEQPAVRTAGNQS